jgi:hypothetical protein
MFCFVDVLMICHVSMIAVDNIERSEISTVEAKI